MCGERQKSRTVEQKSIFQHAETVRQLVNLIMDEYGVPMWLIIVGMVVATILIGIMLGLVLVFILDRFFGTKKKPVRNAPTQNSGSLSKAQEVSEGINSTGGAEPSDSKKDK